jgi:hypothetical protein
MIPAGPIRGEETWASLLAVRGYLKGASQIDFVGNGGTPRWENAWTSPGSAGNTVFRCPVGVNMKFTTSTPDPASKTDQFNSFFSHPRK